MDEAAALQAFKRAARRELYPKVRDATVFVAVCPPANEPDPQFLLELGAALWYQKPLVIIAFRGVTIPLAVRAQAVAVYDDLDEDDPDALRRMGDRVEAITKGYKALKKAVPHDGRG